MAAVAEGQFWISLISVEKVGIDPILWDREPEHHGRLWTRSVLSSFQIPSPNQGRVVASLVDYNELKIRILRIVDPSSEYDSIQIRERLASEGIRRQGEKAVEMALLRYWRQGLLSRTRRGRRFYYRLTERGKARKEWLLRTMKEARYGG